MRPPYSALPSTPDAGHQPAGPPGCSAIHRPAERGALTCLRFMLTLQVFLVFHYQRLLCMHDLKNLGKSFSDLMIFHVQKWLLKSQIKLLLPLLWSDLLFLGGYWDMNNICRAQPLNENAPSWVASCFEGRSIRVGVSQLILWVDIVDIFKSEGFSFCVWFLSDQYLICWSGSLETSLSLMRAQIW